MSIFVQLDPVPWEILDRVRARILANRRENLREQQQVARPQRTATRARFNNKNQNYRRPEASAPLQDANMFLLWERGTRERVVTMDEGDPGSNFDFRGTLNVKLAIASPNGNATQAIESGAVDFRLTRTGDQTFVQLGGKSHGIYTRCLPAPSGIIYTAAIVQVEYVSTQTSSGAFTVNSSTTVLAEMSVYVTSNKCVRLEGASNNIANMVKSAVASRNISLIGVPSSFGLELSRPYQIPLYEPMRWGATYREIQGLPPGVPLMWPVSPASYVSNDVDGTVYSSSVPRDAAWAAAYETQLQSRDPSLPPRRMRYRRPALPDAFKDPPYATLISASDFGFTSYVRTKAAAFGV